MEPLSQFSRRTAWLFGAIIAAVNLFICGDAFTSTSCNHLASWHGAWLSLARLAGLAWIHPTWWRYWGGGEPLALSYAPFVPFSVAAISGVLHCPREQALNILSACVYCAAPVLFYLLSWRLSRRAGPSFAAALAWSLISPISILMPDAGAHQQILDPRRLMLVFEWDDLPRITSLVFLPLAAWGLARALERRRWMYYFAAGIGIAGMMLPNTVGAVLAALLVITLPLAINPRRPLPLMARAGLTAALAYMAICPWLPPSFFLTTHSNEIRNGEAQMTSTSFLALACTVVTMAIVWRLSMRYLKHWYARWLLLAGTPVLLIAAFWQYAGWHFLPQAWRFKMEAEVAIIWMATFALVPAMARLPRGVCAALLVLAILLAGRQAIHFRRNAQNLTAPTDVARTIQYRSAKWLDANLPGQRVFMGGTLGTFLDDFVTADEFSAEQFTSGPNFEQKIAVFTIYTGTNAGDRDAEYSLLWLRAFGVHAIGVPGPRSPEYWKPFAHPHKFDGALPVLWSEDDTTIYAVPGSPFPAHALLPSQLVRRPPLHGLDVAELSTFTAAQDAAPGAGIDWADADHARIAASVPRGDVLATQITYDPGWRATANGAPVALSADGLGLMVVHTACDGPCDVRLEFDGGREWRLCLAASILALLASIAFVLKFGRTIPL